MKTTLEILENEIKWKIKSAQEEENYEGRVYYLLALEGVLRQIKGLKDEEKRLIVNAFEHVDFNLDDGQHYFEQTFKKTNNETDSGRVVLK